MKKFAIVLGVLLAIGLIIVGIGYSAFKNSYNNFVKLSQTADNKWAQVENVYQRRADLVPNLVATVKGAAAFEHDTLVAVTEARARVGQGAPPSSSRSTRRRRTSSAARCRACSWSPRRTRR